MAASQVQKTTNDMSYFDSYLALFFGGHFGSGLQGGPFLGQIPSPLWILVNFFMAQLSLRRVVALAVVALGWGHTGPWWEQELLENRLEKTNG